MSARSLTKSLLLILIILTSGWMGSVFAQPSIAELNQLLGKHKASVTDIQNELESIHEKIGEAQLALGVLRKDLSDRQVQLATSKRELDADPGPNAERIWQNESRRVQMSKLAVEAREATLDRLRSKQTELEQQLATTEQSITRTEARIRNARQAAANARQQAEADALRQAEEAAEAEEKAAQERASRLAEEEALRAQQAEAEAEAEAEAARNAANTASTAPSDSASTTTPAAPRGDSGNNRNNQDPTQTVMAGEEPIFTGDDGDALYLRSRNINEPLLMIEVEPDQFRGEAVVNPGKTYFDIGGRRYRGTVTDDGENRYLFHYDRSKPDNPKLHIFKR